MKNEMQDLLSNNLLNVRVQLHVWSAKIRNSKGARATEEKVGAEHGTKSEWMRLMKPEMRPVHAAFRAARLAVDQECYSMGLLTNIPKDKGKVVPSIVFDKRKGLWAEKFALASKLAAEICQSEEHYQMLVDRDMKRHGLDANRNYYPADVHELRDKFLVDLKISKFSIGQTMLFDIMDPAINDMEKVSEAKAQEIVNKLTMENFNRIKEPLKKLATSMAGYGTDGSYFKQATIDEIDRVIDAMGGFNFSGDKRIDAVIDEIKNTLSGLDAKALRKSEFDRVSVQGRAESIVKKIEAYF